MENIDRKMKTTRNILSALLGFLSLGALFGGATLIISPSGGLLGMPISMLDQSPFSNFLLPGIILFLVLGILPFLVAISLLKRPGSKFAERLNIFNDMYWAWTFTIYVAFALIIWIQLEMVFLHGVHWLHTFYMIYALAILFVVLLPAVRKQYKVL